MAEMKENCVLPKKQKFQTLLSGLLTENLYILQKDRKEQIFGELVPKKENLRKFGILIRELNHLQCTLREMRFHTPFAKEQQKLELLRVLFRSLKKIIIRMNKLTGLKNIDKRGLRSNSVPFYLFLKNSLY